MGRLSTIEDVEKRRANSAGEARVTEQSAPSDSVESSAQTEPEPQQDAPAKKSAAQAEMDFHGLAQQEGRSAGHTALVVVAVVVVIAVAVNFANYTLHFF